MPFWKWSRTAATNASADPTINWAEGQPPSSVNDSARGMMAALASYRDDIAGAIVTTGTSTAYAISSYSVYDTLANMNGALIAFTPHLANGATVTLNVDGLGAKPLRLSPGVELQSNILIVGTPYMATYSNADAAWYLHGLGGNAYGVPLAAGFDFWGLTAPSSAFAFPVGQAISRTTYSTLFNAIGTQYGSGDGSTTFNLPNKKGRVSAMQESSSNLLTNAYFGGNSTVLGATGGSESVALTAGQIPNINSSANNTISVRTTVSDVVRNTPGFSQAAFSSGGSVIGFNNSSPANGVLTSTDVNSISVSSTNTGSGAHGNVQPTIICNYLIRVI